MNDSALVRKGTNLVVTSMAERRPVALREAARIEGRATLRTTKTRFVPRLTNSLHLNFFPIPTSRELECAANNILAVLTCSAK